MEFLSEKEKERIRKDVAAQVRIGYIPLDCISLQRIRFNVKIKRAKLERQLDRALDEKKSVKITTEIATDLLVEDMKLSELNRLIKEKECEIK